MHDTAGKPVELVSSVTRNDLILFLDLRQGTPQQIGEFARRVGVLGTFVNNETFHTVWVEPCARWREIATAFYTLVNVTLQLDRGLPIQAESWKPLRPYLVDHEELKSPVRSASTKSRERIGGVLNSMLKAANVGPLLTWTHQHWSVEIAGRQSVGIYGGLVLRLTEMIVGAHQLAVCSHCARVYIPQRKPAEGKRSFCPQCKADGIPLLYAKRDQLKRKEEKSGKES